jgi:hypothetical protein
MAHQPLPGIAARLTPKVSRRKPCPTSRSVPKRRRHQHLLRGPRPGPTGRSRPRVPAQRPLLGAAAPDSAGRRIPCDHLRPPRVRPVQPTHRRVRLRHLHRRPERADRTPRPQRRGPDRVLHGHRRGHPLPGHARLGPRTQGGVARHDSAVPAQDRRQPRRRRQPSFRRHQSRDRGRPVRHFADFLNNFYNTDKLATTRISDQAWQNSFIVATGGSPHASYACVDRHG